MIDVNASMSLHAPDSSWTWSERPTRRSRVRGLRRWRDPQIETQRFAPVVLEKAVSEARIRVEVRRGAMTVIVEWPASARERAECGARGASWTPLERGSY